MSEQWRHQVRVYLPEPLAQAARSGLDAPALRPLAEVLQRHRATLVCQLDAFEHYVATAEQEGPDRFPLYGWTKATLADPAKRQKHLQAFALRIADEQLYPRPDADALEADLQPLIGLLVTSTSRHDTNPDHNLPVPQQYRP